MPAVHMPDSPHSRRCVASLLSVSVGLLAALAPSTSAAADPLGNQSVIASPTTGPFSSQEPAALSYPPAPPSDQIDHYHGVAVPDPYRWLEDADSPQTRGWIEAENKLTFSFLESIPQRQALKQRLTSLWNYQRYGIPQRRGGRYFYTRNDGLQNQSVLYWTDSLAADPQVLLDPNQLSPDGTVSLTDFVPSEDGRLLAYGLAEAGSDWQQWRVRNVADGRDHNDLLEWVKFSSVSWTPDHQGFFYSRYDQPARGAALTQANYYQKLYYHRLGTPQSADRLIYHRPDQKEWGFSGHVTDDGRYLIITVWRGAQRNNQVFYLDLADPPAQVVELITGFDAEYSFLGNDGPLFWFHTDLDAPRYRIVAVDTRDPARNRWRQVVPQRGAVLESASLVGGRFIATYLRDARSEVRLFALDGSPSGIVELAGLGSVGGFGGRQDETETFYAFTSFTTPTTIYRYDVARAQSSLFRRPEIDFPADDYETRQVFYTSRDGTSVPMFLVHRKGLVLSGRNPTLLSGYGGFNISLTPTFSVARLVWLERGGVLAVPNLRGGGEYGRSWHEAGMLQQKQNVFDDFIAAAQWLIDSGYTAPDRLAINGRSNGGLLVAACLTQRPDLFAAALPGVGVLDMLRFHKFTIGWAWVSEYGSADDPEHFAALLKYSPLHNIRPGTPYPATLITTADHDDRVVPAHSFKFAAALQAAQSGPAPILIRIETSAGHGAGTPTAKLIEETADGYAFLIRVLGMQSGGDGR